MVETYDIVYILKNNIDSEELKYSIRSVVENFPYKRIIFYCGCPNDLKPDVYIPFKQEGFGKINKVIGNLKAVMANNDISENFWLFNDDFFIMRPYKEGLPWYNGTLKSVAKEINGRSGNNSRYTKILQHTAMELEMRKKDILSYATHTPILINRKRGKIVLDRFISPYSFRSAYGNLWEIGGEPHKDIKIVDLETVPEESWAFLSTNDISFKDGKVGEYIREKFNKPSTYELAAAEERVYCNVRE